MQSEVHTYPFILQALGQVFFPNFGFLLLTRWMSVLAFAAKDRSVAAVREGSLHGRHEGCRQWRLHPQRPAPRLYGGRDRARVGAGGGCRIDGAHLLAPD